MDADKLELVEKDELWKKYFRKFQENAIYDSEKANGFRRHDDTDALASNDKVILQIIIT